jgi:hypothetical protein
MNERIRELARQARDYVADAIELGYPQDQVDDIRDEKFAELIVRECADILDPNSAYAEKYKHAHVPGPDGLRTPLSTTEFENMQSAQKLRDHFGVK